MKFEIENAKKIKLIIWDLDETFWKGTLSDNNSTVQPIKENCDLVKKLTSRGIINAVCSKNDKEPAEEKLKQMQMLDYFVFNSINWNPKGNRIKNMISSMALRGENVLFIDDNATNLAEVEFIEQDIMVAGPDIVGSLLSIVESIGKDDKLLSRLNQYKVLEKKRNDEKQFDSNIDFLKQSNIKIQFCTLEDEVIPRIIELIQRSNQLNFTKKRIEKDELKNLMQDEKMNLGYVTVSDNYGEYGIVGFYAVDITKNKLEHFLFSCRTMGMGIEQFVYATLGYPELEIIEPVSGRVSKDEKIPDYIQRVDKIETKDQNYTKLKAKVLMKGPCDLSVMASYIGGNEIALDTEFNFCDKNGNQADYFNHTLNILNSVDLDNNEIQKICTKYQFLCKESFETNLFSGNYDVVCLSPLMDATLGVYKNLDGVSLAYGLYNKPIVNRIYFKDYIEKKVMTARSNFNMEQLENFGEEFKQVEYSPENIINNIQRIIDLIISSNSNCKIVILTLAELPFESKNTDSKNIFIEKEKIHKKINDLLKYNFGNNKKIYILDVNKYINSQADYFDNINHYSKLVYYKMATEFTTYVKTVTGSYIKTSSRIKAFLDNTKRNIYKLYKKINNTI